jgi:hypothetical protein
MKRGVGESENRGKGETETRGTGEPEKRRNGEKNRIGMTTKEGTPKYLKGSGPRIQEQKTDEMGNGRTGESEREQDGSRPKVPRSAFSACVFTLIPESCILSPVS